MQCLENLYILITAPLWYKERKTIYIYIEKNLKDKRVKVRKVEISQDESCNGEDLSKCPESYCNFLSVNSKCSSQLLQATDNYAILCLDIVWCYLTLQNLEHLPDAGNISDVQMYHCMGHISISDYC